MKVYKFGSFSKSNQGNMNKDLVLIFEEALRTSPIDFGISNGARTFQEQLTFFLKGASKLDPRDKDDLKRAKHVICEYRNEAEAGDIYAYVPGRKDLAYDTNLLTMLAGHILGTAKRLYIEGKITITLRWGGNWDMDGEVISDQKFIDLPHFEINGGINE
jgi:hypothetical protein